jgi:nucleoside-diphosphate-sugar epimerase
MTIEERQDIEGIRVLGGTREHRLAGRVADLYADDRQFRAAEPSPAVIEAPAGSTARAYLADAVGTAEVIRLAITTQIKPVTYLSTVAVAMSVAPGDFEEDGDIRTVSPVRGIDETYANGYANSKWALRCCCGRRTTCAVCQRRCFVPT